MRIYLKLILFIFLCTNCNTIAPISELQTGSEFEIGKDLEIEFVNKEFLDSIFQDKEIILLGELDHGDGTSFVVKSKMVKYLHENLGFNTLFIEASQINCFFFMNALDTTQNIFNASKRSIHHIWSQVKETQELLKYIQSQSMTKTPLKLIGIDPQFSGTAEHSLFIRQLEGILPKDILNSKDFKVFEGELSLVSKWLEFPKKADHKISEQEFIRITNLLELQVLDRINKEDISIWKLVFENIRVIANIKWFKDKENGFKNRDEQMFKNLDWYHSTHPDEKCIVWAANAHVIRNDEALKGDGPYWKGIKKFGDHVHEKFGDKAYSVGFTTFQGKTADWASKKNKFIKIKKPRKNSIEYKLKNFEFVFLDLSLFEIERQLKNYESQLLYTNTRCMSIWSENFDGVIFIKTMNPSTRIKNNHN